jgi:hypothetical protein
MKDIDIAKKNLIENDLTLSVVKGGKLIYNSKQRGVLPIYIAVTDPGYETEGASVADKVTGKGAALLCVYGRIKRLHTGIISESAAKVLRDAGIEYTCDNLVGFIRNRQGDGRCPVEILTKDIKNPEDALQPIKDFLQKTGALK